MIYIAREHEEYYIAKDKIVFINAYQNEDDEYVIVINFGSSENEVIINCFDYDDYSYVLKQLKEAI